MTAGTPKAAPHADRFSRLQLMLFYEYSFIFLFLPLVLAGYHLLPRAARNGWLLVASCVFYSVSSLFFLPVLLLSTAIDYLIGHRIHSSRAPGTRKLWLTASVALNLVILAFFKYSELLTTTLRELLGVPGIPIIQAPLPIGISFYTFQSMSYSIDIFRGVAAPTRSFLDFGAYITMFPQLIAGPIVRFGEIRDQLGHRARSLERFADGMRFFALGLAKKILVADTAAALADPLFDMVTPGFWNAWASVFLFSIQIYFDFSGYSDMAVGLGKMLGFEFPQNFDSPYRAISVSDFWRRWHMTLSRWLRDNLYIPLGGNRRGPIRTYVNLFLTMLLGGIWHGAGWNYLVWGLYHGLFLAAERRLGERNPLLRAPVLLRRLVVFWIVSLGWTFFRCEDFAHTARWFHSLLGLAGIDLAVPWRIGGVLAVLVLVTQVCRNTWDMAPARGSSRQALAVACFVLSILVAYGKGSSPFLYFRF